MSIGIARAAFAQAVPLVRGSGLGKNGMIYAIGGWIGSSLSANEAYNPATNRWTEEAPL
jgi:hypothetical protein